MKTAIVLGSTGLIGRSLVRLLHSEGIITYCVGRKTMSKEETLQFFGFAATYITCSLERIKDLPEIFKHSGFHLDPESVLYNAAWNGHPRLTEGGLKIQLANVSYATDAIRVAKAIGCRKVVATGSLEETRAEHALSYDHTFDSIQFDYTVAKLATRDMCQLVAYLEKIDYVHTRLSIVLARDLTGDGFVAGSLRKILQGLPFPLPKSRAVIDIIFTDDIAKALLLLGKHGKNKGNYYIGTGNPTTLIEYFKEFAIFVRYGSVPQRQEKRRDLITDLFDIEPLQRDANFVANTNRFEIKLK